MRESQGWYEEKPQDVPCIAARRNTPSATLSLSKDACVCFPERQKPPFTGSKSSADCKDLGRRGLLRGGETQGSVPTAQLGGETDKPHVLFLLREKLDTREPLCEKTLMLLQSLGIISWDVWRHQRGTLLGEQAPEVAKIVSAFFLSF